ncbi:MAG: hypothetical protein FJX35_04595 [Alphaproteobacteria bacterium]|nr:hypothetical protein [Alphaproteobacteria bacterium]
MTGSPLALLGLSGMSSLPALLDRFRRGIGLWIVMWITIAAATATAIVALAGGLFFIFEPDLGAAGAAVTTALVFAAAASVVFLFARRHLRWMSAPAMAAVANLCGHSAATVHASASSTGIGGAPSGANGANGAAHGTNGRADSPLWNVATLVALGIIAGLSKGGARQQ